jgi:hypothetical protein
MKAYLTKPQTPIIRRQLKFMTDRKILLNFSESSWTILECRGKPEHGRKRSWDGRGYAMTRRKLRHQFGVYHRWINYHNTKGGSFWGQNPSITPKKYILKYCFNLTVYWLNFRHLNFTFLSFPCWILHKNKKFAVRVQFMQHLQFWIQHQMEMFHNALCSYSTAVLIAERVTKYFVLEFRKEVIMIFRFIKGNIWILLYCLV